MPPNASKAGRSLFWTGLAIVTVTHVYMVIAGLPQSAMLPHAVLNLLAATFIFGGWKLR